MRILLPDDLPTLITGVLVLGVYGATYFGVATALGLDQAGAIFRRIKGMLGAEVRRRMRGSADDGRDGGFVFGRFRIGG